MEISLDTYFRHQDDDRKVLESLKFDMTKVYREIHSRPEDLKPVQTFTESGNG